YPAGDSLTDSHCDLSDESGVRILGCTQNQVISSLVQQIDETRIAMSDVDNEVHNLPKHLIQVQGRTDGLADLVKDPELLPRQIQRFLNIFNGIIITSHLF